MDYAEYLLDASPTPLIEEALRGLGERHHLGHHGRWNGRCRHPRTADTTAEPRESGTTNSIIRWARIDGMPTSCGVLMPLLRLDFHFLGVETC